MSHIDSATFSRTRPAKRRRLFLRALSAGALAALVAPPALAQPASADNPEARAGDLRIMQLWTTNPDGFKASIAKSAEPRVTNETGAMRNQPIHQFIAYANCRRDPDDHCWLSAKVHITGPDGKPYGEQLAFDPLPLGPAAPRGSIGIAPNSFALVIEDGEQLGRYRIELAVTDEIAVQTAVSVVHLDIGEAGSAAAAGK